MENLAQMNGQKSSKNIFKKFAKFQPFSPNFCCHFSGLLVQENCKAEIYASNAIKYTGIGIENPEEKMGFQLINVGDGRVGNGVSIRWKGRAEVRFPSGETNFLCPFLNHFRHQKPYLEKDFSSDRKPRLSAFLEFFGFFF